MIVAAAVRLFDGEVVKGFRHGHAFILTHRKRKTYKHAEQGFVTDTGLFLDREKAARHAWKCRQIPSKVKRLMSETVWPHDLPEWGTRPPLWELWRRP